MDTAINLLKKHFGYESFRDGQSDIIKHILNGEDALAIMPTGAGKSICYQIPALILPGVTIVISPLISLMKDQVDSLKQVGINATFINSTLTDKQYFKTIDDILSNTYKIIYVAPERLNSESFINLLNKINISMITIDEAHCVSQWGHDFRPSYREIAKVISSLEKRPIVSSFTATATKTVKEDIISLLNLVKPYTLTTGFDRKNLSFAVETPKNKTNYVIDFLIEHQKDSGIIYCSTRKTVDALYEKLLDRGYAVSKYHGGMSEKNRTEAQEDFTFDRTTIMVATNAFGMGIDKSNIRYVIHYNMPKDLESYYQEAGRAGRDGDTSKCILLYSRADIMTNRFLIEQTVSSTPSKVQYDKLNDIIDYCNTDKCLRKYILEYFGENPSFNNCKNCSNCLSDIETTNITEESKKILSCIYKMQQRFGSGLVVDVLKGVKSEKIRKLGFDTLSTYGIMREYSKDTIKDLINFLITEGYIECVGDKYPTLMIDATANDILFKNKEVFIKRKIKKDLPTLSTKSVQKGLNPNGYLFEILREVRRDLAKANDVPPFIIFTDVTLKEMATFYPTTKQEMLTITGVGVSKLENYGDIFIKTIKEYIDKNNIEKSKNQVKQDPEIDFYDSSREEEPITKITDLSEKAVESVKPSDDYDQELFEILRQLRLEIAKQKNVSAFVIFTNKSLKEMAKYYPKNETEMLQIKGVGPGKVNEYGEIFIKTINDYIEKRNINPISKLKEISTNQNTPTNQNISTKTDTRIITYILYKEGKTIEEIAIIRNLKQGTIENHLLACYESGLDVDIEKYIHTEFKENIYEAIGSLGYERVGALKEYLPEEVTYLDIHYYIAKYKKEKMI